MNDPIIIRYYPSPMGELILGCFRDQLCLCDWRYRASRLAIDNRIKKGLQSDYVEQSHALFDRVIDQLEAYFQQRRKTFDIPLLCIGSPFQYRVWRALEKIPCGMTQSYRELADSIGAPNAVRAVGGANGANALSILIPCHRVVGTGGDLAGYAGGLATKRRLLELESDLLAGISCDSQPKDPPRASLAGHSIHPVDSAGS